MNWSDERYVKFYVRNTATWVLWPWQARAVFPSLLKTMNGAGIIETGSKDPLGALSVLIMLPREVVEVGMAAIIESGTVEPLSGGFLMPKFIEAQEAVKTDSLRKRDQRERARAQARELLESPVTRSHAESRGVTRCPPPAQPSPAQPSPAQISSSPTASVNFEPIPPPRKKPKPPPAPDEPESDPSWQALVDALTKDFNAARNSKPAWHIRDFATLKRLRKRHSDEEIRARWARGLVGTYAREVHTVTQLEAKWNALSAAKTDDEKINDYWVSVPDGSREVTF